MQDTANRFGPRTLLIWGVALAASLWLAMTAVGGIAQTDAPRVALAVYPQSGFAFEQKASDRAMGADVPIQKMRVSDADLADALAALRREPLATAALTMVGLSRDQHGDHAGAAKIIAGAHGLDRRQLVANAWLINHYGTSGRDREVLNLLDEALKIRPQLSAQYMPAFAQALQNPETIGVFQTLLRGRPSWEKDFWQAVAGNAAALPNAEVLRGRILAGAETLGPTDALLIEAYIRAGRMDLALSAAKSLPTLPEDRDNLLRNSSFAQIPQLPPLDWMLISDGRISAAINEGRATLEISALPGAGGTVARQLVALPPGRYALLVKLGQAALANGSDITAHLYCAEKGVTAPSLTERLSGDLDRSFIVADAGCRFWWLDLDFSAIDSSGPVLGSIAEVRITRGRPPPSE
ncbi:MAG: hypothetical protein V4574_01270 [Pseudomonadota bacterium]